jgi:hypothetical protein
MRIRLATALLVVATSVVACSPSPTGPTGPAAPDQVTPDDAVKATGARATAEAFVRAYASDTGADPRTLARLVDGKRLQRWVHWLGVQDREFPGTISGAVENDEIGPAAPFELSSVPGSGALLRDVDVQATITFSFQPHHGKTITLSRSLDGPMRLLYDDAHGTWGVLDFTRDGIPLSQTFEVVADRVEASRGGIEVTLDSFVSVPYWQFFLRVSGDRAVRIAPRDAELLDAEGARVAVAQDVTTSLRAIDAGAAAEGIVTFPGQASAGGLTLRVTLRGSEGATVFHFALGGMIHPVPLATGSPSPSP